MHFCGKNSHLGMKEFFTTTIGRMRAIAFFEGISFLILLFYAMPLKYMYGKPEFVRMYGSVHGALFLLFVLYVFYCMSEYKWSYRLVAKILLISIIPFGNFYADKYLLKSSV
jgi:integral membrane protein